MVITPICVITDVLIKRHCSILPCILLVLLQLLLLRAVNAVNLMHRRALMIGVSSPFLELRECHRIAGICLYESCVLISICSSESLHTIDLSISCKGCFKSAIQKLAINACALETCLLMQLQKLQERLAEAKFSVMHCRWHQELLFELQCYI